MDLSTLTLTAAVAALAAGTLDPVELVEAALERTARLNPRLNAFIRVTADEARAAARSRPRGPLYGAPLALKDLYDQRGLPTTAASALRQGHVADEDGAVTRRLRAAGAVLTGKLNMHEWALGVTNLASHYGPVRNPWNLDHVPGGSSGGSGAAVAAGLVLGATGSDTGGSIRIPAALCGVVGLKPTYGRVSLRGVVPLSWSLDHAGPLARTVRDAALLYSVMAGYDPGDPYSADRPADDVFAGLDGGVRGLRIGLPRGYAFAEVDPEIAGAFGAAVDVLAGLGAEIVEIELDDMDAVRAASGRILSADAAAYHEERLAAGPGGWVPAVYERMRAGLDLSGVAVANARRAQVLWQHRLARVFDEVALLVTPAAAIPAPAIAESEDLKPGVLTRFTNPFNLSGSPALSVPCGFTRAGLPAGLQIVGRHWDEATVLRAGRAYEAATEWHRRTPPLA